MPRQFKFTFEDGSEAIAHHGVKGMKWGVWNAETRMKYKGSGNVPDKAGAAGGAAMSEDEKERKSDAAEVIREWSADGEEGYSKAAETILDRELGKGKYSKEVLSDATEIVREWSPDGEKGYSKAAEMVMDRAAKEKKKAGVKTSMKVDPGTAAFQEEADKVRKRIEELLGLAKKA